MGAVRPELDPGQDGDGHQQPPGEQDMQGEAEDDQGHDGNEGEQADALFGTLADANLFP